MAKENEILKCDCGNDDNHIQRVDSNGETLIECTKCKRFLKFHAKDTTTYKGKAEIEKPAEKIQIDKEKQTISPLDIGAVSEIVDNNKPAPKPAEIKK